ncbi:hypothetical protein WMY93_033247 [Mugilogobius chulae]|uniref:Uncharacterized protein n=1 Tax=Mugilogobius chulae TaxID=88201 RepID=A0AAW0MLR6_9GOBI
MSVNLSLYEPEKPPGQFYLTCQSSEGHFVLAAEDQTDISRRSSSSETMET